MKDLLFLLLFIPLLPVSADSEEIANYKSGISVTYSGESGRDYMEEYFYHDKLISDRKVVYIRSDTVITMAHNERNRGGNMHNKDLRWVIGINGLDGEPESGDEGIIRYKIDQDLRFGNMHWADHDGNKANIPAYTEPFTLAELEYEPGVPVLGSTGPKPGVEITNRNEYYHRGIQDASGDEWHILYYADDDSGWLPQKDRRVNDEFYASDGKSILFVVDPKTPALSVEATGNAQFYTTPPKAYYIPIIHPQTTYLLPREGDIQLTLKDIMGRPVHYRIVTDPEDGTVPYLAVGGSQVRLSAGDFASGTQYLQYYCEGLERHLKTRTIVLNPPFPSAGEEHGHRVWGGESELQAIRERLKRDPWRKTYGLIKEKDWLNGQDRIDRAYRNGDRPSTGSAFTNAFLARINGITATPENKENSYASYAKRGLLDNQRTLDPVGHELSHTGVPIPTRELHYRGYYDVSCIFDALFAYDILTDIYTTEEHPEGLTPIEDLFVRDMLAGFVLEALQWGGNWSGVTRGGMWDSARRMAALCVAIGMPTYSTPYYGTSGFDGNTTVYPWTPYPDDSNTWKRILFDNDTPLNGFPNQAHPLGLLEYNIVDETGQWLDRVSYFDGHLMGGTIVNTSNFVLRNTDIDWAPVDQAFKRGLLGNLDSKKFPKERARRFIHPGTINQYFPATHETGSPIAWELIEQKKLNLHKEGVTGMIWFAPLEP